MIETFKVLEPSYINSKFISQEQVDAGFTVDIETDVSKGGMKAGTNLEPVKKAKE